MFKKDQLLLWWLKIRTLCKRTLNELHFHLQVELTVVITLFNTSNDLRHLNNNNNNNNNDHGEMNEADQDLLPMISITDTNRITSQEDRRIPDRTALHGKRSTRQPGLRPNTPSRWPDHGEADQHLRRTGNTVLVRFEGLQPQQPPPRRWATGSGRCRTVRVRPPDRQASQQPCKMYFKLGSLLRCSR